MVVVYVVLIDRSIDPRSTLTNQINHVRYAPSLLPFNPQSPTRDTKNHHNTTKIAETELQLGEASNRAMLAKFQNRVLPPDHKVCDGGIG